MDNNTECGCKNQYDTNTFMESFGKDDNELKKCAGCDNFQCNGGIYTCEKFNK